MIESTRRDRVAERDEDDVEGSDRKEDQLEGALAVHDELSQPRAIEEREHERPADADEEAVAAGHVGDREAALRLGRVRARLPGQHRVDCVLGENGDEGDRGQREALRDVELGRFPLPQLRRNAAERMPTPKRAASKTGSGWKPARRKVSAGTPSEAIAAMSSQ